MDRRGFLGGILATCAAPAVVRAESLMKLWVPSQELVHVVWRDGVFSVHDDLVRFFDRNLLPAGIFLTPGNGVFDDSPAVQAALDYVARNNRGARVMTEARYRRYLEERQ